MYLFHFQHLCRSALYALTASVTILSLLFVGFFFAEPAISRAQVDTSTFQIRQQITGETSFLVHPATTTTNGTISGVTGGNASGTTEFSVISNNATGYRVEIAFVDNSVGGSIMIGKDGDESIRNYSGSGAQPSWGYTASTAAQFAYTVSSDTPSDTAQSFLNNSSACNAGSNPNGTTKATKCWMAPSTGAFEIVNRETAAITGATSTIEFDITVPSSANPTPTAQWYTATATLSLYTQ